MAVNDLMMRIQLLVDSGKSSAQIGRVSKALTDFNKQLEKIANVKLDLKQQIAQFDELKQSLKQVNAKTFVQELAKVENAFKRLQLDTKNLDDLRNVFTELDLKKSAQQANDYAGQIKKINDQIKEAKKYKLTSAFETPQSALGIYTRINQLLEQNKNNIKQVTDSIKNERQAVIDLNKQLKDSANLYAIKRIDNDPTAKTLQQLTDALAKSQSKLSGFNRLLSQAKDRLDLSKEGLRSLRDEAKQFNKTKLLDFGIKQSDVATIDGFLSRVGKSIDVASIQNARNEIISLKDQIRLQQDEVKSAKLVEPAALGDLNRVKALLRSNSDELARQSKQIADQKKLRAEALLLTDAEYKKIKDLRAANENTAQSIASYTISAKQAKQFISELNSEIRGIKFDAKLAKELRLPDQSAQLSQLKQIRSELQSIDINRLSDLRNKIREIQQGNARGTFTFVNQNQIEGERDSIRKVTQDIRDLRQLLRVEGQPNLINFKDSSGQVRNLINEITTLKNRALQLKTISAGDGLVKVSSVDTATQQRLSDELKSLKERNELYVQASTKLGEVKTAFENSHAAAKAGDAAAKKSISDLIKEYNQLSKVAGLGANSGLQVNVKTETAIAKIKELEDSLKTLSTKNYELFTKTFSDLNNLKPIEIDTKVALSGLNQIQKAIRDIKSEQQAFKLEKIVPLDAQTKVYEKEKAALDLLRESVKKYNEENDKKEVKKDELKLERYKNKVEALASEFKKLTDAGNFNKEVFTKIFSGGEIGNVDLGNLLKQIDLLERQSAFGKINSALLNQQNAERAKELATLVRQEAIGKNNLATIKEQLDQVNQLVTAERNRAKVATQEIKSNQLNSKLSELNALKAINEELKTILKTEDTRRKGLRETARLLLEQGKLRSFNFNTNDLQSIVNANKAAREQAEQSINALKNVVQQRKDEISQLEKQKQLNAESYQREIDRLNATRAVTEAQKKANEVEKLRLTSLRDQQQVTIDFNITNAQNKLNQLQSSFDQAKSKLNDYILDARVAAKEAENLAQSDISGRQASIRLLDQAIGKIKERVKADEQAIKSYEKGIKAFEQQIKADIRAANERIASNQLTKAQYEEEKKGINDLIKLRKQYSNEYIQTLKDRQTGVEAELRSENDRIKLLERQAKAVDAVTKAQIEREIASRKSALAQQGGLESQVKQSIRDTEAQTRAELNRLKALEQIESRGNSLFSIFHRLNGTASVQPAIQATKILINEVETQLNKLATSSQKANERLGSIGSSMKIDDVNAKIKDVAERMKLMQNAFNAKPNDPFLQEIPRYQKLRDQMVELRRERQLLNAVSSTSNQTSELLKEKNALNQNLASLKAASSEMGRLQRFMAGFQFALTPEMLGMSAFGMVAGAVQQFIRSFIDANRQIETMTRGMDAIFGVGQGEVQFEKLAGLANKYGLALQDLSRNYLNLNASAKGTQLEGAEADRIFRSLSAAMAVLGADTITTQRAFRAVGQMISKGQVYAEELKGQLAEALPGAIQLFAKSMGKTTQEFLAMVKAGQVGVNELIPFFKEIEATYGNAATASTTYEQATNRLSNAWVLLMKNIGDTGAWEKIVALISSVGSAFQSLAEQIPGIDREIKSFINELESKVINIRLAFNFGGGLEEGGKLGELISKGLSGAGDWLETASLDAAPLIGTFRMVNRALEDTIYLTEKLRGEKVDGFIELKPIDLSSIKQAAKLTREEFDQQFSSQDGYTYDLYSRQYEAEKENYSKRLAEAQKFNNDLIDLNSRRLYTQYQEEREYEDRRLRNSQASAAASQPNTSIEQIKQNKQFIRQITDELKTQQQAYYTINTIQQKVLSNELKRLQALSGISGLDSKLAPLIIDEAKSTISLTNALKALSRAREIESAIVRNNADANKNTKPEEIMAIRKLTQEQLNHAMTIARSANNQSLVLGILREQSRVMRDIRLSEAIFNEQPLSGLSGVSQDVRTQIEGINKALAQSTTETNNTVREMSELLSLTEQRNRLLKLKTDSQFDQASYAQQIAWEQRLYEVETKTKSKRKRAVEALSVANEALAAAQQQLAIMQTSQDPAEVERARAQYEKLLKFIDPLTGKFQNLKKDAIAFNQAFSDLKIQGVQVALNVNDQAIDQQLAALETKIKSYVEYINQDTGELDFTKAIDVAVNNLNDLQKQYKDLQDQVNRSSGDDKTALERQMKSLLISIAEAESQLKELQGNFNAQNVGKPIEFTIDPAIQEDLKTKLGALQTILNGKPLTFETQVDAENPDAKVAPAHRALQGSAQKYPIIYPAQVELPKSQELQVDRIHTSLQGKVRDIDFNVNVDQFKIDAIINKLKSIDPDSFDGNFLTDWFGDTFDLTSIDRVVAAFNQVKKIVDSYGTSKPIKTILQEEDIRKIYELLNSLLKLTSNEIQPIVVPKVDTTALDKAHTTLQPKPIEVPIKPTIQPEEVQQQLRNLPKLPWIDLPQLDLPFDVLDEWQDRYEQLRDELYRQDFLTKLPLLTEFERLKNELPNLLNDASLTLNLNKGLISETEIRAALEKQKAAIERLSSEYSVDLNVTDGVDISKPFEESAKRIITNIDKSTVNLDGLADVQYKAVQGFNELVDIVKTANELARGVGKTLENNGGGFLDYVFRDGIEANFQTLSNIRIVPVVDDKYIVILSRQLDEIKEKGRQLDPLMGVGSLVPKPDALNDLGEFVDLYKSLTDPSVNPGAGLNIGFKQLNSELNKSEGFIQNLNYSLDDSSKSAGRLVATISQIVNQPIQPKVDTQPAQNELQKFINNLPKELSIDVRDIKELEQAISALNENNAINVNVVDQNGTVKQIIEFFNQNGIIQIKVNAQLNASDIQSKIEAIKTQLQSLESQIPQGIVSGGLSNEVNAKLAEIAKLRVELVNLQAQLNGMAAVANKPVTPKVDLKQAKAELLSYQQQLQTLKQQEAQILSQLPQGVFKGNLPDNPLNQQLIEVQQQITNTETKINSLNTAAQKPIAPVVNTQPLISAQQEITKVTQTINESKIGEPIVVTMETQQAIAQLQELIRQRDEFQKNGLSQPNVDPSTYYNTLDQMQQKINALMDNTDMAVAQFVKNYSMHFVKGNEIVVNSFSEIKSRGIDALRKDYQNLKLDNIEVNVDEEGFRKQVKRLEIVGQNSEPFIMRNFQVQANTWDEMVSEGNRYMRTKELILKGKLDPNSVNDLQAIPVKPTFDDPVQAYRDLKDKIEQQNPIVVSANAQSMIGEIQSELARLQDSGATNIKVTFDEESGKLVVTADTDPANQAVNEIIRKIESKDVVLTVRVREVQAKSNGGYIHRRTGGAIPGYGGGDRVRALLEPGEFVLRKESVRSLGLDYLNRLNQLGRSVPKLSDGIQVPRFANGGAVSGQPIVINVPGNKPIRLSGSRDAASQLVKVLTQTGRAL